MEPAFIMKAKLTCLNVTALSVLFALSAGLVSKVHGGVIESRADLLAQLGPAAITEDFEAYKFPTNTAERVGTEVDATSVIDGQGPGLVQAGVRFIQAPAGEGLQWDRQFQYGLTSAAMVSDSELIVDFTVPVSHAGFNMFWFDVGFPLANPSTVQVYAADDVTMLYSTNIFEPFAPDSYFFGYTDSRGIGRIVLFRDEGDDLGVSPMIDNLTFGFVPESTVGPLLSIALSGQQVTLSWSQIATNYQLEATTNLALQASWFTVTNVPVPLNSQNTVTLPVAESRRFFRLHSQ